MTLLQALNWRYAAKRMNGQKVSQEKIDNILEAIRLSASSVGLQPYTILVVSDPVLREKMRPVANNQPQIVEASHVLVFAAWENITAEHVEEYINHVATVRSQPEESLSGFKNSLLRMIKSRTQEENFNWATRQAYLALGTGLTAAAVEKVDASPMEGFNAAALDELLQLKEKGLRSVSLLALGYRDPEKDSLAQARKVRRSKEELFIELS
jgi:nitroreductase